MYLIPGKLYRKSGGDHVIWLWQVHYTGTMRWDPMRGRAIFMYVGKQVEYWAVDGKPTEFKSILLGDEVFYLHPSTTMDHIVRAL